MTIARLKIWHHPTPLLVQRLLRQWQHRRPITNLHLTIKWHREQESEAP